MALEDKFVGVIGLGYVGLPLAVEFGRKLPTIGFDVKQERIVELKQGRDRTGEVSTEELANSETKFTDSIKELEDVNFYIIAVPTPVDNSKQPDLRALIGASETVAQVLKKGDSVVYESTVYPGATEETCIPILERVSGLTPGIDFEVGYSPERINPGDKEHGLTSIVKVVSALTPAGLENVAEVYAAVVDAGVFKAESIKVAEAAKVIENIQRDLNIALVNELAIIFDKLNIDTNAVLEAASTKWNFLNFRPGLVGGHCIGVDPYYLTHKAEQVKHHPQVILSGRRTNDGMGKFIAQKTIKELIRAGHVITDSTVTVLGMTFKENCPDIRNTRVIDIVAELEDYGLRVQVSDPLVDEKESIEEYGIKLVPVEELQQATAVIVAVAHDMFRQMGPDELRTFMGLNPVLIDVKGIYSPDIIKSAGIQLWRL